MESNVTIISIIAVAAALAIGSLVYVASRRSAQQAHNREIVRVLRRVSREAGQRGIQATAADNAEAKAAIEELRAVKSRCPSGVVADVERIDALWTEMSTQLIAFTEQPPKSTLQSSLVTTRAMKMAEEIRIIAERVQHKLDA
ncbi:MAG: hypothetical protein KDI19_02175 [Pseudomonadales bacterium]|nr:hypothetical protein [Pseudomonadales bacterium]